MLHKGITKNLVHFLEQNSTLYFCQLHILKRRKQIKPNQQKKNPKLIIAFRIWRQILCCRHHKYKCQIFSNSFYSTKIKQPPDITLAAILRNPFQSLDTKYYALEHLAKNVIILKDILPNKDFNLAHLCSHFTALTAL